MALARGYVIARYRLALVVDVNALVKVNIKVGAE